MKKPKILLFDIETSPMLVYAWGLWDQNIGIDQIKQDWNVLSWAAKWLDKPGIMYMDQSKAKDVHNDKLLLQEMWKLLDECDIVITQNGKKFDEKKLNARFLLNDMKKPSPFKHIDTLQIMKKNFALTSNKLAFATDKLCNKHKKSKHKKFPGFELWKQCLNGNKKAWKEMELYNKADVLSLEELYHILAPWDQSINFNLYHDEEHNSCNCGSDDFEKRGFAYTSIGRYQRYRCKDCGAWSRSAINEFSKEKKQSLHRK